MTGFVASQELKSVNSLAYDMIPTHIGHYVKI